MMMMKKKEKDMKKNKLPLPLVFLSDDLIAEILSLLNVKTIVRFKCVSKSWNTLISDPTFVQKQLKKSSQNHPRLLIVYWICLFRSVQTLPVARLLENSSITVSGDDCHGGCCLNCNCEVVNSCNELLCFLFCSYNRGHSKYWFHTWNPATGTRSKAAYGTCHDYNLRRSCLKFIFGSEAFGNYHDDHYHRRSILGCLKFTFGCEILTETYKVVEFCAERDEENNCPWRSHVRVVSLSDDCWRNINSFPLIPLMSPFNNGVYLRGTIHCLAIQNYFYPFYDHESITHVDQFKIVSLDLSTETYMQFLLPSGFDEIPCSQPTLQVLLDRLCFSHDFKQTEFVIWQMKAFGFQES